MSHATREFTGRHLAMIMTGFFAVVIVANMTLAILATKSWSGLQVENSYVASQHFNQDAAIARNLRTLGIEPVIAFDKGMLMLKPGKESSPAVKSVSLVVGRPTTENEDRLVSLLPLSNKDFGAKIDLGPGIWRGDLHMKLTTGESWTGEVRFQVGQ